MYSTFLVCIAGMLAGFATAPSGLFSLQWFLAIGAAIIAYIAGIISRD